MARKDESEGQDLLRKITLRDVLGKPFMAKLADYLAQAPKKKSWLVRIVGVASMAKPGQTDKGPFVKFVGDFEGTNLLTGEIYRSAACILPNFIGDQIFAAMQPSDEKGSVSMAQFAFDIGAHFDDSAITKYVYDVRALVAPKASGLLADIKGGLPALPAPAALKKAA